MRLGLLQCGHTRPSLDAPHGGYPELYGTLLGEGFEWRVWMVCDGAFPEGPEAADGWLLSGSRHGAYEAHDWIAPLEDLIRAIAASGRPMVGICFGHQIVAQALGGRVEKFAGGWRVGATDYDWGGAAVRLNAWHQDQVVEAPPGARVTVTSPGCAIAGFAVGETVLTLQPHPEFPPAYVRGLAELSRGTVPDDLLAHAVADDRPLDNAGTGRRLAAFFRAHAPVEAP